MNRRTALGLAVGATVAAGIGARRAEASGVGAVIASADATAAQKAIADAVAPGTEDNLTIVPILADAQAIGEPVTLLGPTFVVAERITVTDGTLVGAGRHLTSVHAEQGTPVGSGHDLFRINGSGRLAGFTGHGRSDGGRNIVKVSAGAHDFEIDIAMIDPYLHGLGAGGTAAAPVRVGEVLNPEVSGAGASGNGKGQGVVYGEYTERITTYGGDIRDCAESGYHTWNNDPGVAADPRDHVFYDPFATGCKHGVSIGHQRGGAVYGGITEGNTLVGMRNKASSDIGWFGGRTEENGDHGFSASADCERITVDAVMGRANGNTCYDIRSPDTILTATRSRDHTAGEARGYWFGSTATGSRLIGGRSSGDTTPIATHGSLSDFEQIGSL